MHLYKWSALCWYLVKQHNRLIAFVCIEIIYQSAAFITLFACVFAVILCTCDITGAKQEESLKCVATLTCKVQGHEKSETLSAQKKS